MKKSLIVSVSAVLFANVPAHAIDAKYREKLERSGCTQVSEMQGCDINKTKAENTKAGFGAPSHAKPTSAPHYKDLVGKNSISAIDIMSNRGFKDVDYLESGNTQYGIFYNPGSRLCVQLTMADSKVISADDIQSHRKCR